MFMHMHSCCQHYIDCMPATRVCFYVHEHIVSFSSLAGTYTCIYVCTYSSVSFLYGSCVDMYRFWLLLITLKRKHSLTLSLKRLWSRYVYYWNYDLYTIVTTICILLWLRSVYYCDYDLYTIGTTVCILLLLWSVYYWNYDLSCRI